MRVISQKKIREFWQKHPDSQAALTAWYKAVQITDWASPVEVRDNFRTADTIGEFIVFDICKNDYRLVVRSDYRQGILYVWDIYTHRDYDRLDFKSIDEVIRKGSYRQAD